MPNGRPSADEIAELVRQARKGNEQAIIKLYEILKRPALGVANRFFPSDAEDIVQIIWMRMYHRNFPVRDEKKFRAFFLKAVKNEAITWAKKPRPVELPDRGFVPRALQEMSQEKVESALMWEEVKEFLKRFPEGEKLLYKISGGHTIEKTAEQFGVNRNQITYALRIARARLFTYIKRTERS